MSGKSSLRGVHKSVPTELQASQDLSLQVLLVMRTVWAALLVALLGVSTELYCSALIRGHNYALIITHRCTVWLHRYWRQCPAGCWASSSNRHTGARAGRDHGVLVSQAPQPPIPSRRPSPLLLLSFYLCHLLSRIKVAVGMWHRSRWCWASTTGATKNTM